MGFVVNQHRRALRRNLSGFAAAYVLALSLIAIIACASHWISLRVTTSQVNAANEIDISGAQRMLSQRIALLLTELETTADRSATLAELRLARDRFRSAHLGLINGDPAMRLNGIQSKELGDIYFYEPHLVNERTETLIFAADRALLNRAPLPAATLAAATALAKGPLLAGLNAVVKRREMDARRGLEFINRVDMWLLVATLIILLAEGLWIFRPLSNRVRQSADEVLKSNEDLRHSMRHDQLTGLPNRRHMREFLDMALSQAGRHGHRVGLLQIDLVGFRNINDTRGHAVGDLVLQRVAGMMLVESRKGDFVARIGANEFAVICSFAEDIEELRALSDRLCALIAEPFEIEGVGCDLKCAAAINLSVAGEVDPIRLQKDVDIALGIAKRRGCNDCVVFSPDMREAFEDREALRNDLKLALERREIEPFFQPQINARTGKLDGFEALARWRKPDKSVISPAYFLDAAAAFGMGQRVDEIIMEKAFDALAGWRRRGLVVPRIGVNITATELRDPFMAERIKWAAERHELEPSDICIEILESVLVEEEGDEVARNIASLARIGFHIDLDDFGTGHASIATLKKFSVDRIKIDRSFVSDIDTDPEQQKVAGAMIDLAHSLGVAALAEGVETNAEYDQLAQMGCEFLQGYGIGKPMSEEGATEWIKAYAGREPAGAAVN